MSKCFFALMMMFTLAVMPATACTNLTVGKKASADGSVMCTYNCDGFGFSGSLFYSPGGRHAPGEKIAIHGWGPTHEGRYVDQVEYTYNVVGLMNEHQVTIVETTFDGRLELQNNDGLTNWGPVMAGTVLTMLPILVIFLLLQRHMIKGLTSGAVKG